MAFGFKEVYFGLSPEGVTVTADKVPEGFKFVGADGVLTDGTMPNNEPETIKLDGTLDPTGQFLVNNAYKIPKGYHTGEGEVVIGVWPHLGVITPNEETQTFAPEDGTLYAKVTVAPIPSKYKDATGANALPSQVAEGVKFLGADGVVQEGTLPSILGNVEEDGYFSFDTDEYFVFDADLKTPIDKAIAERYVRVSVPKSDFGNAYPEHVLERFTFTSESGIKQQGTIPVNDPVAPTVLITTADDQVEIVVDRYQEEGYQLEANFSERRYLSLSEENGNMVISEEDGSQLLSKPIPDKYVDTSNITKGDANLTVSGATVTAPAGYYPNGAKKSVTTATRATTTLTSAKNNDTLVFTAANNQGTGYVNGSNSTATKTVSLSSSGATVTASDGTNSISKSVSTVGRASTSITTTADDTNDVLTLTASNNQGTGYVNGSNATATKKVTLSVSGATVTATDNSSTPVKISKSVATADRAATTLTSAKSNNTLVFTARNNQGTGYVTGSNSTATKTVSISASGKTVTATDETNSISASVKDGSATTPATTITATNTITFDEDSGLITATASGSKSISPTVTEGYVKSGTAGTVSVSGTNTLQLTNVGVAYPTVNVSADDEEGEIYIGASTTQPKGYCKGGKSAVVGKYIKLKIEGDTAVMYDFDDQSKEVRRKVGASINTCTVNVTFTTNAGNTLISATTFANGAFSVFTSRTKTGTVTIPNVVCGSAVSIATSTMCSLYWSGSVVNHHSGYGGTITVPTTANATHTVEVGVLDD